DGIWVEHPRGQPMRFSVCDPAAGLAHFERLAVETQSCQEPAMKWFVAMNAGLFPFVRHLCVSRLIQINLGDSQSGKTSGATRFCRLHALGEAYGNASVASLNNEPDPGLLALDNKENSNFTQDLIDFFL